MNVHCLSLLVKCSPQYVTIGTPKYIYIPHLLLIQDRCITIYMSSVWAQLYVCACERVCVCVKERERERERERVVCAHLSSHSRPLRSARSCSRLRDSAVNYGRVTGSRAQAQHSQTVTETECQLHWKSSVIESRDRRDERFQCTDLHITTRRKLWGTRGKGHFNLLKTLSERKQKTNRLKRNIKGSGYTRDFIIHS